MVLTQIAPIMAVVSIIAGVVGAYVGVKFTANSARQTAEETAKIVQGLATSVAVLQVQVSYLSDGLKQAGQELNQLRETMRSALQ